MQNVILLEAGNARTYLKQEGSEAGLAEYGAPSKFIIHTKAPGFRPGCLSKEALLASVNESFARLKVDSVETYFFHAPDPQTPIEESVDVIQELYAAGKFKHFGLSNFKAETVRKIYDYAVSKDYVLPTIYQGIYNPISRHYETSLFPLLRELKIAFYAYSPLAGGFLVKKPEIIQEGKGEGRWDPNDFVGARYLKIYHKPSMLKALTTWESIANEAGISKAALAYRYIAYNSILSREHNDGIIVGASSPRQLEQTLKTLEDGPLDPAIAEKVDQVWESVKDEAPPGDFQAGAP